jgi:Na+/H+ antiporter NhaD/arsenite permease-like protein
MTFNEKSRWIALVANLGAWGWYFVTVARALAAGAPDEPYLLALTIPVVIWLTIVTVVAHIVVAVLNPREARTGLDERERKIAADAARSAYALLSVGIFGVIVGSAFLWNTFFVVNALLFAFLAAESARYALELAAYRRMAA